MRYAAPLSAALVIGIAVACNALREPEIPPPPPPRPTSRVAFAAPPPAEAITLDAAYAPGVLGGVVGGVVSDPEMNTEAYARVEETGFLTVAQSPLSTFSIDVDTASYANVRRFLSDGALPPPDAVRLEEMLNYFPYDLDGPRGSDPFAVHVDVGDAPWAREHRLARIALKAREVPPAERPAANLVFLIDVSGSMQPPNKLPLLERAMKMLVESLEPRDRVAMVVYAGSSGLVLPPTDASRKTEILDALDRLEAGGSTNGGEGLALAYATARGAFVPGGINRVVLCTDGDFNVGVTNEGDLTRLIEKEAKSGVFLTVLGFGMGNYKDSTLEALADRGNGNYGYIDSPAEARKMLVEQAGGTLVTVAKDVKIQVEFNPAEVAAYRLIGYENRRLADRDFDDDTKDAGEIGAGHSVTALYEIVPAGLPVPGAVAGAALKYQTPTTPSEAARGGELFTVKLRYKDPEGETSKLLAVAVPRGQGVAASRAADFDFAAAVAEFGMVLRGSEHRGSASFEQVRELAARGLGRDPGGYRAEFLSLVGRGQTIAAAPDTLPRGGAAVTESPRITLDLLRKYDRPGPRYTSYPTAVEFNASFGPDDYVARLAEADRAEGPLSLYTHLPFCEHRCTFCGCHVVITRDGAVVEKYLDHLHREIDMLAAHLPHRRRVSQYHWGGGTPTHLDVRQIEALHAKMTSHFDLDPDGEIAIEVDPRHTSREQIDLLRAIGFNRVSMGVQDFDPAVQEAVDRNQTEEQTRGLYDYCREKRFHSINLDLIYGLPLQTREKFSRTIRSVVAMRPDRVALYSYAHVPWVRAQQKYIRPEDLPSPEEKLELFVTARDLFLDAGYAEIGMDHFAVPEDELATARRARRLHRNFMGYTVRMGTDMVAVGVSGIGDVRGSFAQNEKKLSTYYAALEAGRFPIERGYALDADDRIRRETIARLMCNLWLDTREIERQFGIDFASYFAPELAALRRPDGPVEHGFVAIAPDHLEVLGLGRFFVRNIAMEFDRYLREKTHDGPTFSRTV